MPKAPTAPTDYKWPFDVRVQPIDFTVILPSGILLGSVAVSATPGSDLLTASVIRAGSKIADIVYAAGTAQTYTVTVDATGNGAIGGQIWKQRVKFSVVVQ